MELDQMMEELGQFGKFQGLCFTMLLFPVLLSGFRSTEYIFTTMNIPHRCRIPECEGTSGTTPYSPPWLVNAVPFSDNRPAACLMYSHNISADVYIASNVSQCPSQLFLPNTTQTCQSWVFAEPARTIAHDFDLLCPSDYWKLTFIGSYPVFFQFVGIPLSGLLSDRLGRKVVLVWSAVVLCITGIIRSFSVNYEMLAVLEMMDGLLSGGIYAPAFVLGLETLSPSKRLLGSMLINTYFPLGEVVLCCLMWWVQDWRLLLRIFYTPMLLLISLHWLLPESVRWLYTQRKFDEMETVLRKIAKLNKTTEYLPKVIESLKSSKPNDSASQGSASRFRLFMIFKSRVLMWRFGVCALCWIVCIFTYYGISQDVTSFGSNRYVSFLLVSLIEVPAYVASLWVPDWDWLGRKGSLAWTFILGGLACIGMLFVKSDQLVLSLVLFLFGKFFSTLTVTVIYLYTAELFPTELRHTMLSLCSMFGRVGSILSQQMPLFAVFVDPMLVFGLMSLVGGALSFTCPETLHTKLPDTIEEAEHIVASRKLPK